MRVAIVHDYLNEYGGAERVLEVLCEMYPEAPIYTAFCTPGSPAAERFSDKEIIESWAARIPGFRTKLHSPLRFLAPLIWESFNFDDYDVVISSSSWYMPKGVLTRPETLHVSYIHTPPRYLYGYSTSVEWQKYWPVRMYAHLINKGLREYDYLSSQRVDVLVANSQNVQQRIQKFYRRESEVIYPPVDLDRSRIAGLERARSAVRDDKDGNYFLTGGRLAGSKNFELIIQAANQLQVPLKVFGEGRLRDKLEEMAGKMVEFVGRVSEEELWKLYAGARAFVVMADDEDFGMTPVEAMAVGTPVLAYRGGGYVESVVDPSTNSGQGATGVLIDDLSVEGVKEGMERISNVEFLIPNLRERAGMFSKERFVREMRELVEREYRKRHQTPVTSNQKIRDDVQTDYL